VTLFCTCHYDITLSCPNLSRKNYRVVVFGRPGSQRLIVGDENADLLKRVFVGLIPEFSMMYPMSHEHAELVALKYAVCRGQLQVRTRDMADRVKFRPGSGLFIHILKVRGAYRDD
jgi:hypothetical protein